MNELVDHFISRAKKAEAGSTGHRSRAAGYLKRCRFVIGLPALKIAQCLVTGKVIYFQGLEIAI